MFENYSENRSVKFVQGLKDHDLYPYFRNIFESGASTVQVAGVDLIMIGSNNYLGLTHHPHVKECAIKAIEKYGTGCTGSRFLNGNFSIHEELEERLARYIGHEASLVFATGMQVNLGAIAALCGPKDCFYSDKENHASIIDGHRLSLGTTYKYNHENLTQLEEIMADSQKKFQRRIIITDGVFSMTGRIALLDKLVQLAKKYDAGIYVDDAHGLGVLGPIGRGTAAHFNLTKDVDFNMGTFSKSFASIGGFISGSKEAINYLRHVGRTFIFSAALPPSAVGTVMGCLDVLEANPHLVTKLWENVDFMQKGFRRLGLNTLESETPVIPVLVGDDHKAMEITKFLYEHQIFATPVVAPATPPEMALIRTSYSAAHSIDELQKVLDVFEMVKNRFDLPLRPIQ